MVDAINFGTDLLSLVGQLAVKGPSGPPTPQQQQENVSYEQKRSSEEEAEEPSLNARKNWTEISVDPKFRALPEEDRSAVADAYFDRVIAPKAQAAGIRNANRGIPPETYVAKAKDEFKNSIQLSDKEPRRLPDVDYISGIGRIGTLYDYTNAKNDSERFKALSRAYGRDNVKIDPGGRFYIQLPDKRKVAVEGVNNKIQQIIADAGTGAPSALGFLLSSALMPEIAGEEAVVGAASRFNLLKNVESGSPYADQAMNRALIAGTGGATGLAANEGVKKIRGLSDQSLKEEADGLAREASDSMMSSAMFDATLYPVGKYVRMMHAYTSSPEEKALAKEATNLGLAPSVMQLRQQTKGAKLWGLEQKFIESLNGKDAKYVNQNMEVIGKMVDEQLKAIGIPESEIPALKEKIFNKKMEPMRDTEDAQQFAIRMGDDVKQRVEEHEKEAAEMLDKRATELLRQSESDTHAALSADVTKAVGDARKQLSTVATEKYGLLEADAKAALPEGLTADNTPLKSFAIQEKEELLRMKPQEGKPIADILDAQGNKVSTVKGVPKGEGQAMPDLSAIEKQLNSFLQTPDRIPIQQLENYRHVLWEKANSNTITPDSNQGFWRRAYKAVNETIEGMELDPYLIKNMDKKGATDFLTKLHETREWYKGEINKFDRTVINKIARDAGKTGAWKEDQLADMLIKPRNAGEMRSVKTIIPPKIWDRIGNMKLKDMFEKAVGDDGLIDPNKLASSIRQFTDKDLREAFGEKKAKLLRELQDQSRALAGHLDPEKLDGSNLSEAIRAAKSSKEASDKYWQDNLLKKLSAGGKEQEDAIKEIIKMDSLKTIEKARAYFGENTKAWNDIQQHSMMQFLSEGMQLSDSGFMRINGNALYDAYKVRGYEQIKEMWGKDVADGLEKIVKWARYTGDEQKLSGGALGMAVMSVVLHIPSHIPLLALSPTVASLYRSPVFIKWVTEGLEGKSLSAQAAAKLARTTTYGFQKSLNNAPQLMQQHTVPGYLGMGEPDSQWAQ